MVLKMLLSAGFIISVVCALCFKTKESARDFGLAVAFWGILVIAL